MDDLEGSFEAAASFLAAAVTAKDTRFDDKVKLKFYGLYKQATSGKCTSGRPGFWDLAGRAKWDAWSQLGDLAKEEAMAQYTSLLSHVAPEWDERQEEGRQPRAKGGMGPVFSSLAAGAEAAGAEEAMGERTLHELAGEGDVEGLRRMLQQGTPVDARDDAGCTALHFAADRGAVEAARVLVEAGADLGARDDEGQTPLHYAAITEQREVYNLLVSAGADAAAPDSGGTTALEAAPASWGLRNS